MKPLRINLPVGVGTGMAACAGRAGEAPAAGLLLPASAAIRSLSDGMLTLSKEPCFFIGPAPLFFSVRRLVRGRRAV